MPFDFNEVEIKEIYFDDVEIIYMDIDGVDVWSKERTLTLIAGSYIKSVSGAGTYISGSQVTITAAPNDQVYNYYYTFDGWYKNGVKVSSSATYTFTLEDDITLEARATQVAKTLKKSTPISLTSNYGGSNDQWDVSYSIPSTHYVVNYGHTCPHQGSGWGYMHAYSSCSTGTYGGTLRCWGQNQLGWERGQNIPVTAWYEYYEKV